MAKKNFDKINKKELPEEMRELTDEEIKFILFVYDKDSPFIDKFLSLSKRKAAVIEHIGANEINQDEEVFITAVWALLKSQKDSTWTLIVTNETVFDEYSRLILAPLESLKEKEKLQSLELKSKLMSAMEEISDRLKRLWNEFSTGDDVLVDSIRRITPEKMARKQ